MHKPPRRIALECLGLVCAPALLAALTFHALVPARVDESSKLNFLVSRANAQPVAAFLVFFLPFSLLSRRGLRLLESKGVILRYGDAATLRSEPGRAVRFVATVGGAAALTLLVRAVVCQPYRVLSASMLPTLEPGAWIIANKLSYGFCIPFTRTKWLARLPQRGDVVALETPPEVTDAAPQLVKRVIGLPGDRITMRGGRPVINGWAVPVCDAGLYSYVSGGETTRGRALVEFLGAQTYLTVYVPERVRFTGYTVQAGEVFVLGDNRNNSSDSRAWDGGRGAGLQLSQIDGRIARALFSPKPDGSIDLRRLFEPVGSMLHPESAEAQDALMAGIARCLQSPPSDTTPPPASL